MRGEGALAVFAVDGAAVVTVVEVPTLETLCDADVGLHVHGHAVVGDVEKEVRGDEGAVDEVDGA